MNWPLVLLDSVAERGSGHTPSQKHPEYWNGGVKWVSLADSHALDRGYINSTAKNISPLGIRHSSAVLHPAGTVILSRDAGVGKSAILGDEMAVSQHFIAWRCDEKCLSSKYLYHWLQSEKPEFERMATGSTVKTIGLGYFQKLRIPLPQISEQNAISEAFDAWDTAIQKTEQLIAAKERHFAATSHLLLTSRKRLNGFSMKWGLRRADEIFENTSRKGHLNEPLLSVTQERGVIPRDMLEGRVTMPSGETGGFKLVEPGNFVISLRSFQGGLEHSNYRGLVSPAYTVLTEVVEIDERFFRHYFKSADFIKRLSVAVIGIRDGKQISFQDFCSIKLPFPSVDEQRAIAALLDQAEDEINLLREYAEAVKSQKRGLMQKLLTGQWRLPLPDPAPQETVEC